jgi:hypothetical protein
MTRAEGKPLSRSPSLFIAGSYTLKVGEAVNG